MSRLKGVETQVIPKLYDGTAAPQGNGIGLLRDCIRCTVTEERNGSYELELTYPITGQHYAALALRALIRAKPNPNGNEQDFRIYKISRPIGGQVTVNAQHISYDLSGVPVSPFSAQNAPAALAGLKAHAAAECPFDFWTDLSTTAAFAVSVPSSIRSLLGGVEGSILDVYGGEYEWDNTTVKLHARRGTDRGVTIRYGKNLTDLTQEENCADVYTGVYPYWAGSDGSGLVQLPEKTLAAQGEYGFVRILPLDLSEKFEQPPTEEQLRTAAQTYMKQNRIGVPKVSMTVSFAQLGQTEEYEGKALLEQVDLGDTVRVEFPKLGVSASARCVKTVYNVLLDRYDSVELGDARANIADTIASQGQTIKALPRSSAMQSVINSATSMITGNRGGYVVLHSSTGSKEPDEILIMDKPDIETARNVWRWNKAGLGFSGNGYNGPYGTAITADGKIVADYIAAGTLNAAMIRVINLIADHLTSNNGNYTLDAWAAVLKLMEGDNLRARLYTAGTTTSNHAGMLQLWSGKMLESGEQDDTTRYTYVGPQGIGIGQTSGGTFTGTLDVGDVMLTRLRPNPKQNTLYTNWVQIKDASGAYRWALCGQTDPW